MPYGGCCSGGCSTWLQQARIVARAPVRVDGMSSPRAGDAVFIRAIPRSTIRAGSAPCRRSAALARLVHRIAIAAGQGRKPEARPRHGAAGLLLTPEPAPSMLSPTVARRRPPSPAVARRRPPSPSIVAVVSWPGRRVCNHGCACVPRRRTRARAVGCHEATPHHQRRLLRARARPSPAPDRPARRNGPS